MRLVPPSRPESARTPAENGSPPLRVAVLSTHRAPGLDRLLEDPTRGQRWEIAAVVATDPAFADRARVEPSGVPFRFHGFGSFSTGREGTAGDLADRADFDRRTLALLDSFRPDLVVLCGYLHIVTEPLLEAFPDRVVNIHDADLSVKGPDGLPRYRGLRSTQEAIFAGEPETRSTVHLATPEVDAGPPLLRSWPFPTHPLIHEARAWDEIRILKAYAYAQREWMMRASWGELLVETVEHFARGEVRRMGDRVAVAGRLGPRDLAPPARPEAAPADASARAAGGEV